MSIELQPYPVQVTQNRIPDRLCSGLAISGGINFIDVYSNALKLLKASNISKDKV